MELLSLLLLTVLFAACSFASKLGPRDDLLCGLRGYDKGKDAYFYSQAQSLKSVESCGSHCATDSQCKSFAVGSGACLHYAATVYVVVNKSKIQR